MAWRGILSCGTTLGGALSEPPEQRLDERYGNAPASLCGASQLALPVWGAKMVPKPAGAGGSVAGARRPRRAPYRGSTDAYAPTGRGTLCLEAAQCATDKLSSPGGLCGCCPLWEEPLPCTYLCTRVLTAMARFLLSTEGSNVIPHESSARGGQTARLPTADRRWVSPGVQWPRCHGDTEGGLHICHSSCWRPDTVWPLLRVCPHVEGQRLMHRLSPRHPQRTTV
jgi:hypothetical protein